MSLGARINELREKRGLTQDQLGELIGKSRESIAFYETGKTVPPTNVLMAIADVFKVSVDYLLGRSDSPFEIYSSSSGNLTEDELVMMRRFLEESETLIRSSKGNVTEAQLRKILKFMAIEFEEDIIEERSNKK